jgi:uncharacterized glyoxalase superfamily protein PhnB
LSADETHAAAGDRADRPTLEASTLSASLTVADLERSLAWYTDVIGFAIERKHERGGRLAAVSLKAGAVRLLLGQDDGARGADRTKGDGMSLQLTTSQDLDEIARRIEASGSVLETPPTDTPWGARVFRVKDPDGFKLVFSTER